MRIGMMADAYKPHISGITIYMDTYRAALEADGHEVYIFTLGNQPEPGDDEHVVRSPALPLPQRGYYVTAQYSARARRLLQSMDVVHVHHPFTSGRIAVLNCRRRRIPVAFTNHTRYDLYARSNLRLVPAGLVEAFLRWYMPRFCAAIELVIAPSASIAVVLRRFGVRSHIEIIPNGVEVGRFRAAPPIARADLGFREDDILVVFAGRLEAEKNLPLLVQAFATACRESATAHLLLVGEGRQRAALFAMAERFGVCDRVHFAGQLPYAQVPGVLRSCDIFATASVSEVHPLSVIEAMAAGLPVVGIRSPGLNETVREDETGILTQQDPAELAAALSRLIKDGPLRARLGHAAREASGSYDIRHAAQVLVGHYRRLVQQARSRAGRAS
jgi:1,2-diacylglycerol 3-alpha-glucosyltransferase